MTLTLSRSRSSKDHHLKNLVGLTSPMLLTKSQGHRPSGSGEEVFKGVLPYIGEAAILVMLPKYFANMLANLS